VKELMAMKQFDKKKILLLLGNIMLILFMLVFLVNTALLIYYYIMFTSYNAENPELLYELIGLAFATLGCCAIGYVVFRKASTIIITMYLVNLSDNDAFAKHIETLSDCRILRTYLKLRMRNLNHKKMNMVVNVMQKRAMFDEDEAKLKEFICNDYDVYNIDNRANVIATRMLIILERYATVFEDVVLHIDKINEIRIVGKRKYDAYMAMKDYKRIFITYCDNKKWIVYSKDEAFLNMLTQTGKVKECSSCNNTETSKSDVDVIALPTAKETFNAMNSKSYFTGIVERLRRMELIVSLFFLLLLIPAYYVVLYSNDENDTSALVKIVFALIPIALTISLSIMRYHGRIETKALLKAMVTKNAAYITDRIEKLNDVDLVRAFEYCPYTESKQELLRNELQKRGLIENTDDVFKSALFESNNAAHLFIYHHILITKQFIYIARSVPFINDVIIRKKDALEIRLSKNYLGETLKIAHVKNKTTKHVALIASEMNKLIRSLKEYGYNYKE